MITRNKIINNAIKILGYLIDNDAMAGRHIKLQQIFDTVGLPEKEFDSADTYLLQQKYVEGTTGGMAGSRWLTAEGVDYYEENKHILEIASQNKRANNMPDTKKVFVVHGRDSRLRDDFFSFLRALGLQPIEWSEALKLTGKATPYVGEALESAFKNAQAVIVLLSPDDEVRLSPDLWRDIGDEGEKEIKLQARPNVLFEAGMAFATHSDRTLLVEVGEVKPFSDVAGRHVVRLSNLPERRKDIAERLRTAGCYVSTSGNDWLSIGNFNVIRGIKTESSSYVVKDINEEDLFEAYGINWTKEYKKRCLHCKSPLKYSSDKYGPSVLFCSNCDRKHVLRNTNGDLITEQQAIEKLQDANKSLAIPEAPAPTTATQLSKEQTDILLVLFKQELLTFQIAQRLDMEKKEEIVKSHLRKLAKGGFIKVIDLPGIGPPGQASWFITNKGKDYLVENKLIS